MIINKKIHKITDETSAKVIKVILGIFIVLILISVIVPTDLIDHTPAPEGTPKSIWGLIF